MEELLKPRDVAAILKITPWMVGQYRRDGRLRAVRLSAKEFRFRRCDVEALIRTNLAPKADRHE